MKKWRERKRLNSQKTESNRGNQVTLNGHVSKMTHFTLNRHIMLLDNTLIIHCI